jgi:DNA-binding CsgD family transcriptional regulator
MALASANFYTGRYEGMCPQFDLAFSLEEAPTFVRGSSRKPAMTAKTLKDDNWTVPISDKTVCIVGPSQLQNSLMAASLSQATEAKCLAVESLEKVPTRDDGDENKGCLILWDCLGKDCESCLFGCDLISKQGFACSLLALFNVSVTLGVEEAAIPYGVQGFFYEQDSMQTFEKGIRAIFQGELWIPRKILAEYMKKNTSKSQARKKQKNDANLTSREREILLLLASGAKNADIAKKLYVSPHTVRTHLHNIYRKIDVPDRFQAILWAAENL